MGLIPKLGIPQEGKITKNKNIILRWTATFTIYSMALPIVLADIAIFYYQTFYFGPNQIPKIKRGDYIKFDRHKLKKLNIFQKINCIYCEYTNGLVEYAKAAANQTEIYNCAIKHSFEPIGQEHQKDFYEYSDFQ